MTALFHRGDTAAPEAPAALSQCERDAYFWVSTPSGVRQAACPLHLRPTLDQYLLAGGQTLDLQPGPGTRCEWEGPSR